MKVKVYIPHSALQDYILNISTVDALLPAAVEQVITPYPATPFQSLFFYCNNPVFMSRNVSDEYLVQPNIVLTGPQISRVNIKVHKYLRAIRVDFLPGGMYRMLGIPMTELLDNGFDAIDFFGAKMKIVNEKLQDLSSLEEGKNIVEQFLLNLVPTHKELLPLDYALRTLLNNNGNMTIEKAASLSCLSLKQFERKCKERIGMNPKFYARILRFSKAYRMYEVLSHRSWIEIAHDAGYFDQMHMIRDFKIFADVNPSIIEQQLLSTPLRMQKDLQF